MARSSRSHSKSRGGTPKPSKLDLPLSWKFDSNIMAEDLSSLLEMKASDDSNKCNLEDPPPSISPQQKNQARAKKVEMVSKVSFQGHVALPVFGLVCLALLLLAVVSRIEHGIEGGIIEGTHQNIQQTSTTNKKKASESKNSSLKNSSFSIKSQPSRDSSSFFDSLVCNWAPGQNNECLSLISKHIATKRWLFFGDSTVYQLFTRSNLRKHLTSKNISEDHCYNHYECIQVKGGRCRLNDSFDLPYPKRWTPPNSTDLSLNFTGPIKFGALNPYCTDCHGCNSIFMKCTLSSDFTSSVSGCNQSKNEFVYGGYIAMEFALDIEIQTPEFLTTQQNLAAYVSRVWNTPDLIQEWGKPMCVMSAGIHDVAISGMSKSDYVKNINFLLDNFTPVCDHIIWLGNTAPRNDTSKRMQTIPRMKSWDSAVMELIWTETKFFDKMSFIDVHESSVKWPHGDHIHMNFDWYQQLGNNLFVPLITAA